MIKFDNDYTRGAHPAIIEALVRTNLEQTSGYGFDPYCEAAKAAILKECRLPGGAVYFLIGGTQTNAVAIDAMLHPTQGVIAVESAHINVHESGAIEATGHKVIALTGNDGKLTADIIDSYLTGFYEDPTWPHQVIPGMVYISQSTEFGTVYTLAELEAISAVCRKWKIKLYLDGARLLYALESPATDVTLPDIARLTDAFYIGGTKAGTLFGEALVIADPSEFPHMFTLVKQHGALLAKGRLLGIQFLELFSNGLYREIGKNAISTALPLRDAFLKKGWRPVSDSLTNQQIFEVPDSELRKLEGKATYDEWGRVDPDTTAVRFTTDWATTQEEIDFLLDCIR